MVRESELMFHNAGRRKRIEYIAMAELRDEHVKPMFEVTWGPILGVYSYLLDTKDDPMIIGLCLEGLKDSVGRAARAMCACVITGHRRYAWRGCLAWTWSAIR
jgi:hypothetical protein